MEPSAPNIVGMSRFIKKKLTAAAPLLPLATAKLLLALLPEFGRSAGVSRLPVSAEPYSPRSTRVTLETAPKVLNSRSWLEMT
jgi:hypothetical protein